MLIKWQTTLPLSLSLVKYGQLGSNYAVANLIRIIYESESYMICEIVIVIA